MLKVNLKNVLTRMVELSIYEKKRRVEGIRKYRKLLIVRIDHLGDFIMFSPALKYFRLLYPSHHVTCLIDRRVSGLAKEYTEVDEWIVLDKERLSRSLFYKRRFLKMIRERWFDTAIYPAYSREPIGDRIVKVSEAQERIAFNGDTANILPEEKARNDRIYTRLIQGSPGLINEIERNREFIESLGARTIDFKPCFVPSQGDIWEGEKILFRGGLRRGKSYIVISPGAEWMGRVWPLEKYAEVISHLKRKEDIEVVISGTEAERGMVETVKFYTPHPIVDITGKVSLPVLAGVLMRASLLISNETGVAHLGAAVGTPVVCIIGGGHFGRFFPCGSQDKTRVVYKEMDCFGCDWWCKYGMRRCIQEISVKSVLEAVYSLM